jgi:hypothetical protein
MSLMRMRGTGCGMQRKAQNGAVVICGEYLQRSDAPAGRNRALRQARSALPGYSLTHEKPPTFFGEFARVRSTASKPLLPPFQIAVSRLTTSSRV